uniref:Uncharacterized protein n=1 Tax=uncultured bacterium fosmid pJB89E1 TaxID=1478073 RepID=A0A0H3U834_9BACT|nr:hypothetical protein [uncultured bacterium fosmid pJB89E1]
MIKNVIFDFGAVLIDWDRRHFFDKYFAGDKEKEDYFLDNICTLEWNSQFDAGIPFKEGCEKYAAQIPEWHDAIIAYGEHWEEMVTGEMPGMRQLVKDVKAAGHPTYGLTNWSWEKLPKVIEEHEILHLIDGIVCSGKEHTIKPFPEIYHILLDRYGLVPDESVFIDDNQVNLDTADTLGIHTIRFENEAQLRAALTELGVL